MKETSKRRRQRLALIFSVLARVLSLAGILLLAIGGVYFVTSTEAGSSAFKLQRIEYMGTHRLNTEAFTVLLRKSIGENLIAIDLERVRSLIESETWIKAATVRRRLPDRLIIRVIERKPVAVAAIDDGLFIVDNEAVVLDVFGPAYAEMNQPIVKGLSSVARENSGEENALRIQTYLNVLEELRSQGPDYTSTISEIDVANPERIAVIPAEEPVAIFLGQDGFRRRYETFLSQKPLYYQLKEKYGLIEYIDVTYDDKIIFHTPREAVSG